MSTFTCDDKQNLIAYVYGEIDAGMRDRVAAHLVSCARCTAEVRALGDVRAELGRWAPPDAELGFAIVRKSEQPQATVLRPARWWQAVPAWAQAAAAVLVVAAGAAIANIQVRSGPDGFTVSTGWMTPARPAPSEPANGGAIDRRVEGPAGEWRTALASLEEQLRSEIRSTRPDALRAAGSSADEATLRRVQQLIAASEERQERELALRFTQFAREMDMMRRADFQRITRGFGAFDEQMLRQQQMLNNVIRISGTPQQ
jgi:hypothetical protein